MKHSRVFTTIRIFERPGVRYGGAVVIVALALLLRLVLSEIFALRLPPYITFFPAVMLAAMFGGLMPGLLATALALVVSAVWVLPHNWPFGGVSAPDRVGMLLFSMVGVFMSIVAGFYHRALQRVAVYERELNRRENEERLIEINRHLELLSNTASQLLMSDNPQGLVQNLCESVMEVLDCHVFFNYLVDDDKKHLHLNAFAGIPDEEGKRIGLLDFGVAVCGCVAADGCRIIAEDILHGNDTRTDLVKSYGVQTYACHPLLSQGGNVIGTLSFGSKTKLRFSEEEISLMKAITDQVATAMERIRLLDCERKRAEEFQAVLDAVPAAVWIAQDSEARMITGNRTSYELLRMPVDSNASKTAPEDERPTHFRAVANGEDIPVEQLPVQRAARGETITDFEFGLLFDDGTERYVFGNATPLFDENGKPRGSVSAFVDITDRKLSAQREQDIEAQKREFYRHTIFAATGGKLLVSEKADVYRIISSPIATWTVNGKDEIKAMRDDVSRIIREEGMSESRVHSFLGCVVEAAANAIKHANGGRAALCRGEDSLIFSMTDSGIGIQALSLPHVALAKGYSTAGTLGMGYKVMIEFADKVYLSTGPEGTVVAIEMMLAEPNS